MPSVVFQPSIPVRQALAKLTLPALVVAAFGVMLLGLAFRLRSHLLHESHPGTPLPHMP